MSNYKVANLFYLYRITKGTKKLSIPKTSTSFQWNAPEVISLCSQGCLYIISKIKIGKNEDVDGALIVEVSHIG